MGFICCCVQISTNSFFLNDRELLNAGMCDFCGFQTVLELSSEKF
ncbi:MAG: hypothetical protein OFPI_27130 [Osedax symbiont Rs2]|nr:MAG: hypothetical protein OFPI_27130 [Osedax symbiont Rs2]